MDRKIADAIKKAVKRLIKPQLIPGVITGASTRKGYSVVKFSNSQVMDIYNQRAPTLEGREVPVFVGYDPLNPGILQVLGVRHVWNNGLPYSMPNHHENHEWLGYDQVWVSGQQYLPLLVLPAGSFSVTVYYGSLWTANGAVEVKKQTVDLSADQPTAGAQYNLIQVNDAGTVSSKAGDEVDSKELLTFENIPVPDADNYPLAAVALYDGQESIRCDKQINDIVDLRFNGWSLAGGGGQDAVTLDADADTILKLIGQQLGLDTQAKNTVFAGPSSGADAVPTIRTLVGADIPDEYPRKWMKNTAPTVDDDTTAGYSKSDIWIDQTNSNAYVCIDDTDGAAVWLNVGSGSGNVIFAVDGRLAVATNVPNAYIFTADATISEWYVYLKNTGSADSTIVDINLVGTGSIFEDCIDDNRPEIIHSDADGWVTATPLITEFSAGDILTFDIDEIATGAADIVCVGGAVGSGGATFNLTLEEADGTPSVENVGKIVLDGLTLTDDGAGQVTITAPVNIAQIANTLYVTKSTHTTVIPFDDTIPQNTEGEEVFTLAITPTDADSSLKIDVIVNGAINSNAKNLIVALFRDSTANAIAVGYVSIGTANYEAQVVISVVVSATSTDETTFKVRVGPNSAATVTVNGSNDSRYFGGVLVSSMTITEIKA